MIRLLSIEDDPDLQRLLALALPEDEFEVHFAFTGPDGLAQALELRPDVILCDLMLPGLSGQDVIRKLKEDQAARNIPVVVVTAHYDAATLLEPEIRKLGIVEYVRKPVQRGEILTLLRRIAATKI